MNSSILRVATAALVLLVVALMGGCDGRKEAAAAKDAAAAANDAVAQLRTEAAVQAAELKRLQQVQAAPAAAVPTTGPTFEACKAKNVEVPAKASTGAGSSQQVLPLALAGSGIETVGHMAGCVHESLKKDKSGDAPVVGLTVTPKQLLALVHNAGGKTDLAGLPAYIQTFTRADMSRTLRLARTYVYANGSTGLDLVGTTMSPQGLECEEVWKDAAGTAILYRMCGCWRAVIRPPAPAAPPKRARPQPAPPRPAAPDARPQPAAPAPDGPPVGTHRTFTCKGC